MRRDGVGGVGAGDQDRRPRPGADLRIGCRLDAQQWRGDHVVALRAQRGGGALRVGLGAREQKPHVQSRTKKSAPPRALSSRPASAPSSAAWSRRPSRKTSNAALPSGFTMMPRKWTASLSDPRVAADRRAAGAVEHGEESALRGHGGRGIGVVDLGDQRAGRGVIGAGLDADRALAHRRQKFVDVEQCRRGVEQAEPLQAGDGEQRRVGLAGLDLAQACLDVAAQRHDGEVRPQALDQGLPPQRCGADHGAARQIAQGFGLSADEGVARILARQKRRQHQAGRQHGGHVLRRMHREVDGAAQQRVLDLLGEQPLAANVTERPVLNDVAGGADDLDLDPRGIEAAGRGETALHLARLHQRQRRAARADAQNGGRGLCHEPFRC